MSELTKETFYFKSGKLEEYRLNNEIHREDGPAVVRYYEDGEVELEEYWLNNETQREDGPAVIHYYDNGKLQRKDYWLNNKLATEEQINYIKYSKQFDKDVEEVLSNE